MIKNEIELRQVESYKQAYRPNNIPDTKTKTIDKNFVNSQTDI